MSRTAHRRLTATGRVVAMTALLAVSLLVIYTFSGRHGQPPLLDAHPAPPPDLVRGEDLRPLKTRLNTLEAMLRDREQLQRQAVAAITETRTRLRTLEDQLGMLQVNANATKEGVEEIRDLLREHMIRSSIQELLSNGAQLPPVRLLVPGTVIPGAPH